MNKNELGDKVFANEKLVAEVYSDLVQPGFKTVGKAAEDLLKFVALPLSFLGLTVDELENKYKNFIHETLNKVPEENRERPKSNIVSPLLDHIKYLFDDADGENLIEMFSELLGKAINSATKDSVHVSYVHTLCQLGSLEAKILMKIYESDDNYDFLGVAFRTEKSMDNKSYIRVLSDVAESLLEYGEKESVFFYYNLYFVENEFEVSETVLLEGLNILEHHNLITSFTVNKVKGEDRYSLEKHDKNTLDTFDPNEVIRGYKLTQYGADFMSACVNCDRG